MNEEREENNKYNLSFFVLPNLMLHSKVFKIFNKVKKMEHKIKAENINIMIILIL